MTSETMSGRPVDGRCKAIPGPWAAGPRTTLVDQSPGSSRPSWLMLKRGQLMETFRDFPTIKESLGKVHGLARRQWADHGVSCSPWAGGPFR